MPKQISLKVGNAAERVKDSKLLIRPNPGDMMMALVFGWAFLCFFLITVGDKLLRRLAGLARSDKYRELLLESDQALGLVMVGGSIALVLSVYFGHRYPKIFLGGLVFALCFADAGFVPLHDFAFALKYLSLVYLGIFAVFSIYKNFWRLLSTSYVRLLVFFAGWLVAVCVLLGGQLEDIWYAGTMICAIFGFAVFLVYEHINREGLEKFFNVISWAAVPVVATHLTAPFLFEEYVYDGRFQSFFLRATAFSVTLTPLLLVLLWRAMSDKDPQRAFFFSAVALVGLALMLWSGSRSPIGATLLGGGLLWLMFRSRLFLALFFISALALAAQLLLDIDENVETSKIEERLANVETGRFELWGEYLKIAVESPIYGYAPSRLGFALAGQDLGGFLTSIGATEVAFDSPHNTYIGLLMRFGSVALILLVTMIALALSRAKQVLFSTKVPPNEKGAYILAPVLILSIGFTQMFEDSVFGSGKGTLDGMMFFASLFICQVYGTKLINYYDPDQAPSGEDRSMAGLRTEAERTFAAD